MLPRGEVGDDGDTDRISLVGLGVERKLGCRNNVEVIDGFVLGSYESVMVGDVVTVCDEVTRYNVGSCDGVGELGGYSVLGSFINCVGDSDGEEVGR